MSVSRSVFKNNFSLSRNVQVFKDQFLDKRALVIKEPLAGLEDIPVKDYYNVVIIESDSAISSVSIPDVIILQDETPYRDYIPYADRYFQDSTSIFVVNYKSAELIKKAGWLPKYLSLNYLPANDSPSSNASLVRNVLCGLSSSPGVHLAKIMGCNSIYYTDDSPASTKVSLSDISLFISEIGRLRPKNLIAIDRPSIASTIIT